jgi:MFS family permease
MDLFGKKVSPKWALRLTFFFMGVAAASAATRFAEVQKNTGASDTAWGLAIMIGNIGSFTGTYYGGKLAHRFGTRRIVFWGILGVAIAQATYGFANALWQIPEIAFIYGASYAICNVGANSQGSMIQVAEGRSLMPSFHGTWSIGAASSSLIAGLVAHYVSPAVHLTINSLVAILGSWIFAAYLLPISKDQADHKLDQNISKFIFPPEIKKFLLLVSVGSFLATMAEVSVSDWSTILLHKNYDIPIGLNTLGYTSFVLCQIMGRFSAGKLIDLVGIPKVIRFGGVIGGIGYAIGLIISNELFAHHHKYLALSAMCISYGILGIGVAPMPPSYVSVAGNIPNFPTTAAVARMSLVASLGFFAGRGLVSILAGTVGLPLALLVSAFALVGSGLLAPTLHYHRIDKTFH